MENTPYSYSMTQQRIAHTGLILAVIIGGCFYLYGKKLDVHQLAQASITVSGEGKISTPPDIATVSFGVQTGRQESAKTALALLTKNMNAIVDAVKKAGIADKDVRTEQFSMNPSYDWTTGQQVLRGYEASQMLTVKVRDLDKVGDILTAATNAGANQAGNVSFVIDDPEKAQATARAEAIDQAHSKAVVLARQLGVSLGRVTAFSEGSNYTPPVMYMARDAAMGGVANEKSLPMPTGEQDINAQVSITYEIQ